MSRGYQEQFERYGELYPALKPFYRALSAGGRDTSIQECAVKSNYCSRDSYRQCSDCSAFRILNATQGWLTMNAKVSAYLTVVMLVAGLHLIPVSALAATIDADVRCQALIGDQFLNLLDAPTTIIQARLASDAGEILEDLGHFVAQFRAHRSTGRLSPRQKKSLAGVQPFLPRTGFMSCPMLASSCCCPLLTGTANS